MFDLLLVLPTLAGHVVLWVFVFNRLHATGLPCRVINRLEKGIMLVTAAPLVAAAIRSGLGKPPLPVAQWVGEWWWLLYVGLCWLSALAVSAAWLVRRMYRGRPIQFVSNDTTTLDLAARLGSIPSRSRTARWMARIPGNEVFQLHIHEKVVVLPRLPAALDGLSIVQLSDLHYAGQFEKRFFEAIVEQANALEGDLVAVTGDIVDKTAFIDWVPDTIGRLEAKLGRYFVLGNHDKRVRDVDELRHVITQQGLTYLGQRWMETEIRGQRVLLAGNEAPWFPAPDMAALPSDDAGPRPFRILLAHSPDQLPWARRYDFDLMLAGHTHGGQIRLPLVGSVICPSRYGVKYAAGIFYEEPTLLHVTRGVAGLQPVRFLCPPELTKLVLRCP